MSALHREWINDQAERVTLEAPELRPVGQVPCTATSTGVLIGCAYRRPMPQPSADAERIQSALLAKPARRATAADAGCISGPHTPPMTLRDKVVVVVGVIGLLFVGGLLAWEGWA